MATVAPNPDGVSCDVAVCGGGLVGATLALALAELALDVVLIEAHPFGTFGQPSFDDRTTALSNGSRRIFDALRVWPLLEREATAIRRIHVSDRGRFGFARLDAAEQGLSALGFVVVNRAIGAALWRRLEDSSVRILAPAKVRGMQLVDGRQRIECDLGAQGSASVAAKLAIAADGAQSALREAAGIGAQTWNYDQTALVTNVLTQRFHDHVAYERFTPSGPLALLPMSEGRVGLIWTFTPDVAQSVVQANDREFLARLQDAFGFRLGRLMRVGARQLYPLALTRADEGFNLGLRDAASLAEVLADGRAQQRDAFDPGDGLWLERYREWRQADRTNIVRFTDGLVRLFAQPLGPIKALRDVGMLAFDLMPAAKGALSQLSLGAAGRIPKLARGASLL
jgi:2-octaprenyl-6-methoxyphenol hydroxylase